MSYYFSKILLMTFEEVELVAIDPVASMQAVANPGLADVALAVRQKLRNVVTNLNNV